MPLFAKYVTLLRCVLILSCGYSGPLAKVTIACRHYGGTPAAAVSAEMLLQTRDCYYEYSDGRTLSLFAEELVNLDTLDRYNPVSDYDRRLDGRLVAVFEYTDGRS